MLNTVTKKKHWHRDHYFGMAKAEVEQQSSLLLWCWLDDKPILEKDSGAH